MYPLTARIILLLLSLIFIFIVFPRLLLSSGRENIKRSNYDSAVQQLLWADRLSIKSDPNIAFLLGIAASKNQDFPLAIRAFRKTMHLDDRRRNVHLELARVYFMQGNEASYESALSEATEELRLFPDNIRAYYVRGLTNGWLKKWGDAENDFSVFVEAKPSSPWGYNDLAWVHFSMGEWDQAREASEQSIMVGGDFMWGYNGLGLALLNQGHYLESIDALQKAFELAQAMTPSDYLRAYPGNDPEFAPQAPDTFLAGVAFNLGLAYARNGTNDEARENFQIVLDLISDPSTEEKSGISKELIDEQIEQLDR